MAQTPIWPLDNDSFDLSFHNGTHHIFDASPQVEILESFAHVQLGIPVIYLRSQDEGGFVAFSFEYPGAIGQGETEDEALQDINSAIELLKEEKSNPSCDVPWPKDFR